MSRLTHLLTLVLAVQLLLVAALFWPRENPGDSDARAALMSLQTADIDRILVDSGADSLLLRRDGARWVMPDYHRLPVQQSRLDRVLLDLPAQPRGWPVASSATATERFEVAPGNFQRKLEYYSGDNSRATLFIGTSPGFRKVHVSPAGDENVYAVEFNTFEVPVSPDEWLDKSLLQIDGVTSISGLDYALTREGDAWRGDSGQAPADEEVEKLVNGLSGLRVTAAADIATASILDDVAAPPTLSVEAAGASYDYRLYEIEDAYYIQRNDIPVYFSLGAFDYDRLNDVSAQSLYAPAEPAQEENDTGEAENVPD